LIRRLKLDVIYGETLDLHIEGDKETIQRFRNMIKALDHNIREEHTYRLSNTLSHESNGVNNHG